MLRLLTILIVLSIFSISCKRDYGCMDSDAINYDPLVDFEDGSCAFEATGTFYWTKNKCFFDERGITHLNIGVDGKLVIENLAVADFHPCSSENINAVYDCEDIPLDNFPSFKITTLNEEKFAKIEVFDQDLVSILIYNLPFFKGTQDSGCIHSLIEF